MKLDKMLTENTAYVFDTKTVVAMDEQILREKLVRYKVALQPNKQPIIWRTICETIENEFQGDIRLLFSENDYSVQKIKEYIANQLKEDQLNGQLTMEAVDPFTGSK